jgi:hypothetical protein
MTSAASRVRLIVSKRKTPSGFKTRLMAMVCADLATARTSYPADRPILTTVSPMPRLAPMMGTIGIEEKAYAIKLRAGVKHPDDRAP